MSRSPARITWIALFLLAVLVPPALADGEPIPDPPPDSLVRTFVSLRIVPEHPCAGDTVTLRLIENGCPPCVSLRSFGYSPAESTIAGVIDWTPNCREFRCATDTLSMSLGVLAAGTHRVTTSMTVVVHQLPQPDTTIHFQLPIQFEVGRDCGGPPPLCVTPEMFSNVPPHQCQLTLRPGQAGDLPLSYESQLPMAALEGNIELPYPFQLADLQLASHITGAHLVRQRHTGGFRWLVFCDSGVTLPPGDHQYLLKATVAALPDAPDGASALMTTTITLASDADGNALPLCIRQTLDFAVVATRLCVAGQPTLCDVNGDGRLDVRDLVRMVTCLDTVAHNTRDQSPCRDCNADGIFDLADIFCCAGHILRGPLVPRDSVRSDAAVSVSFDPIEADGSNLVVRVRVLGARTLGAALLRFSYPFASWHANARVPLDNGVRRVDTDWLPIADFSEPGQVRLGAVRLGDSGSDEFMFEIELSPVSGGVPGHAGVDRLRAVAADLAARDGAIITPQAALPTVELQSDRTPGGQLELSPARPNPFNGSTRFVVRVPTSALVDLAVHDLAGRRIATLAHAVYEPGRYGFNWDATGARDGLYFVRLTVGGQVLTTRAALLRDTRP